VRVCELSVLVETINASALTAMGKNCLHVIYSGAFLTLLRRPQEHELEVEEPGGATMQHTPLQVHTLTHEMIWSQNAIRLLSDAFDQYCPRVLQMSPRMARLASMGFTPRRRPPSRLPVERVSLRDTSLDDSDDDDGDAEAEPLAQRLARRQHAVAAPQPTVVVIDSSSDGSYL
jgi:hypothetical protein